MLFSYFFRFHEILQTLSCDIRIKKKIHWKLHVATAHLCRQIFFLYFCKSMFGCKWTFKLQMEKYKQFLSLDILYAVCLYGYHLHHNSVMTAHWSSHFITFRSVHCQAEILRQLLIAYTIILRHLYSSLMDLAILYHNFFPSVFPRMVAWRNFKIFTLSGPKIISGGRCFLQIWQHYDILYITKTKTSAIFQAAVLKILHTYAYGSRFC